MNICIIHIGKNLQDDQAGITQKTLSIARALEEKNCVVRIISFSPDLNLPILTSNKIDFIFYPAEKKWSRIHLWLEENILPNEIIWFRYPFANHDFFLLTKKWGRQMVLEHNTFETEEALLTQKKTWKKIGLRFTKSFLKFSWDTFIKKETDEHRWGPLVLKNVLGGITVTNEISDFEISRYPGYKTFVLPNCIDQSDWPDLNSLERTFFQPHHQKWVMVIGNLSEWHGLKRLFQILEQQLPKEIGVQIDLIGIDDLKKFAIRPHPQIQIRCLGKMKSSALQKQLLEYDLAIGSLSLHQIGLSEASPLKVREYWRCGLPVLLAYQDSACLENKVLDNFNITIPNDISPIPIGKITLFLQQLNTQPNWKVALQNEAKKTITYNSKSESLIQFLIDLNPI